MIQGTSSPEEAILPADGPPAARLPDLSQEAQEEYRATLALRNCPLLGVRSQVRLLKNFGSARAACEEFRSWPRCGVAAVCVEEFVSKSWQQDAREEWNRAAKSGAMILLWESPHYPAALRELPDAPALLYCLGDIELLSAPCIALVGTRNPDGDGIKMARQLASGLSASGLTVVSGMALGLDREIHKAALGAEGRSIGVLGTGIDIEYPYSNSDLFRQMREQGLLVSEFAPGTQPMARNFPVRNRIISGISLGVVVVEAAMRSGSLITARLALEQNREVFAVPGSPLNARFLGCNDLIRAGARSVINVEQILLDLSGQLHAQPAPVPTKTSRKARAKEIQAVLEPEVCAVPDNLKGDGATEKVMGCLANGDSLHIDALLAQTGLDSGALSTALLGLEMAGRIRRLPGSRFEAS